MGKHSVPFVVPTTRSGRVKQRTRSGCTAFFWYGMPVIIFASGILTGTFGVSALQAAVGHGTRGYFIAQSYGCGRRNSCGWSGEFELADGTIIGTDFSYQGADVPP